MNGARIAAVICLLSGGVLALVGLPAKAEATAFGDTILVSGYVTATGSGANQGIVVAVNTLTGFQHVVASNALLSQPQGIAADAAGNVFVAQSNNIVRIDGLTGQQTILSSGQSLVGVTDIAMNDAGKLYALANLPREGPLGPATIVNVNSGSGAQTIALRGVAAEFGFGQALAAKPSGDVAFMNPTGCGASCIAVVSTDGSSRLLGIGIVNDIAFSKNNELLLSLNPSMGPIPTGSGPGVAKLIPGGVSFFPLVERPIGIDVGHDNSIYGALSNQVIRIDQGTGSVSTISAGGLLSGFTITDMTIVRVPEPSLLLLLGVGLLMFVVFFRRQLVRHE
jgi:hypothetical protein